MTPTVTAALRQAIRHLETEREGIDRQIAAIQSVLGDSGRRTGPSARTVRPRVKVKRRRMSAAARKAVSQRMKAYWAKRRAAKARGSRM